MQTDVYLSTEQAAAYLNIKERKLYELVANGAVPCSKVTGKWLFPRGALDRWIESGLCRPEGFVAEDPPAIIGGSQDLLLDWAVRRSGCGLAQLAEGSEAGLRRLERNEVSAAVVHLHDGDDDRRANETAVAGSPALHDAVVIGFVRREQGLVLASGNPLDVTGLADAAARKIRFGQRQAGAGARLLLERLGARDGFDASTLAIAPVTYPTGQDLAFAIRSGDIDSGLAPRSVAEANGLAFLPLAWENVDLVLRRRTYFQPGMQTLMTFIRGADFARQARHFGGYDTTETMIIRMNR